MDLKMLQFNVFEDGLTETPGAIGFRSDFRLRLTKLLRVLSGPGTSGQPFLGFASTRDFSGLPDVVILESTELLFGHLEVLYTMTSHFVGGECRIDQGPSVSPDAIFLGNSLRTLFLHSAREKGLWVAPDFDAELKKATRTLPTPDQRNIVADRLRSIRDLVWGATDGRISFPMSLAATLWKRDVHVRLIGACSSIVSPAPCDRRAVPLSLSRLSPLSLFAVPGPGALDGTKAAR